MPVQRTTYNLEYLRNSPTKLAALWRHLEKKRGFHGSIDLQAELGNGAGPALTKLWEEGWLNREGTSGRGGGYFYSARRKRASVPKTELRRATINRLTAAVAFANEARRSSLAVVMGQALADLEKELREIRDLMDR